MKFDKLISFQNVIDRPVALLVKSKEFKIDFLLLVIRCTFKNDFSK